MRHQLFERSSRTVLVVSLLVFAFGLSMAKRTHGKPVSPQARSRRMTSRSLTRQLSPTTRIYRVEPLNDPDFLLYPPPPPVYPNTYQFNINENPHDELIPINSTNL